MATARADVKGRMRDVGGRFLGSGVTDIGGRLATVLSF